MIRRLLIENFRCLRHVELKLEPLTVLVGGNGSGKSSVLAALQAAATKSFQTADRWAKSPSGTIRVRADAENGPLGAVGLHPGGLSESGQFPNCQILQLDVGVLRQANTLAEARQLAVNGYGLANVFTTLPRQVAAELVRSFCAWVPTFSDVQSRPQSAGTHRLLFQDRWRPGVWYEPHEVSDGSMLMFALLAVQYQDPQPDLIAIEQPECGLHPYLIDHMVSTLRRLSAGDSGKKVQVLMATHSAVLLEFVEASEVRFFSRSKDTGETLVEEAPVDSPGWHKAFHEYDDSLGKLWLSGALGGVPGS